MASTCDVDAHSLGSAAATQADAAGSPLLVASVQGQQIGPSDGTTGKTLRQAARCSLVGWRVYYRGCGSRSLYVLRYLCYDSSRGWYYVSYSYCG